MATPAYPLLLAANKTQGTLVFSDVVFSTALVSAIALAYWADLQQWSKSNIQPFEFHLSTGTNYVYVYRLPRCQASIPRIAGAQSSPWLPLGRPAKGLQLHRLMVTKPSPKFLSRAVLLGSILRLWRIDHAELLQLDHRRAGQLPLPLPIIDLVDRAHFCKQISRVQRVSEESWQVLP